MSRPSLQSSPSKGEEGAAAGEEDKSGGMGLLVGVQRFRRKLR